MNLADVYRKAAEVIVRDGKTEHQLVGRRDGVEDIRSSDEIPDDEFKDRSLPVCALGACARAEWELYGTLPARDAMRTSVTMEKYSFMVPRVADHITVSETDVWMVNDNPATSAEDIALLLKHHAEEVQD